MRILIINSEHPPIGGGAGNASAHVARQFVEQGHEVSLMTSQFGDLPSNEIQDGVHISRIRALRQHQDRSNAVEQISFMLSSSCCVIPFIRKWHPDVILAYFGVPSGAAAWTAKLLFGVPYIISLRGGDVPGFRPYDFALYHRLISPFLRMIWRRASYVVANSQGLKDLADAFDAKSQIEIIPNGVDLKRYVPADREWDHPRMLFVGRLVYQKGLDILLTALADLKPIPWKLSLVGDGPQYQPLQSLADSYAISDRIEYQNWLDRKALLEQYRTANLFVFPSRHEGMPNAVLEAMACGLPVIATRIAGNEELVLPDETGLLVEPENAALLKDALQQLLIDASQRRQMGANARLHVEQHYSWQQIANQYLALMQK